MGRAGAAGRGRGMMRRRALAGTVVLLLAVSACGGVAAGEVMSCEEAARSFRTKWMNDDRDTGGNIVSMSVRETTETESPGLFSDKRKCYTEYLVVRRYEFSDEDSINIMRRVICVFPNRWESPGALASC